MTSYKGWILDWQVMARILRLTSNILAAPSNEPSARNICLDATEHS